MSTAEAIEGLRELFAAEEPLEDIAARVARTAVAAIPHADAVSITMLTWPDTRTAASTDERARQLDCQQYASGRGPCLEAAWQGVAVRAVVGKEHHRWPEFVEVAQCMSATLPTLFRRATDYQRQITFTPKGVVAVETSSDPNLTQAIRAHAVEVTGFVNEGMPAMMRPGGMTGPGGMMRPR